ncbi:hypothetical protein [Chitinophaga nivalis]|uniref:DUF4595 domain-containing protein n=1 Tax=Chitinophaga nivalis TaxID=2991709 RepID=A0ABT3IJX1_9BACT|nr:hypothetical protein [Chitinophaga nivalis]MCW3466204.1 hypothetical protein [Chitinophaga nivalis]MCW3484105.1 hypothetical protein [Chitinophaga nivalis]
MTHRKTERMFKHIKLNATLLAAALLVGTACNKSQQVVEGDPGFIGNPAAAAPVGYAPAGQLTSTSLGTNGIIQKISYNSRQQPLVITHYAGNFLTDKDSVVYDASGKLLKVLNYTPDFLVNGKFELSGTTTFEWDSKGYISRKKVVSQEGGTLETDDRYTYDATGRLLYVTTKTDPRVTPGTIVTTYSYENKNIKKVTRTNGTEVIARLLVTGFDNRPTFITHPLLPYLLDGADNDVFSEHNAVETKNIVYIKINGKLDSTVTVTKNTFQYNAVNRPVKVSFKSTISSGGNPKPITSSGDLNYTYAK